MTAPEHSSTEEPRPEQRDFDSAEVRPRRTQTELAIEAAWLLPNIAKLLSRLVRDPRVPFRRKVLAAAVLGYVVSPLDLIPDFLGGLGRLDDLLLAAIALNHLMSGAGREVVEEHWDGSEDALDLITATLEWGAELLPGVFRRIVPS